MQAVGEAGELRLASGRRRRRCRPARFRRGACRRRACRPASTQGAGLEHHALGDVEAQELVVVVLGRRRVLSCGAGRATARTRCEQRTMVMCASWINARSEASSQRVDCLRTRRSHAKPQAIRSPHEFLDDSGLAVLERAPARAVRILPPLLRIRGGGVASILIFHSPSMRYQPSRRPARSCRRRRRGTRGRPRLCSARQRQRAAERRVRLAGHGVGEVLDLRRRAQA